MESLTGDSEKNKRQRLTSVDRVSIGKDEGEKVSAWIKQLEDSSKGFLQLTKSDIVNFLIREHSADLGPKETGRLRQAFYDPIKHINWITQELKTALAKNDLAQVSMLQAEIKRIELSAVSQETAALSVAGIKARTKRKSSKKQNQSDDANAVPEKTSSSVLAGETSVSTD